MEAGGVRFPILPPGGFERIVGLCAAVGAVEIFAAAGSATSWATGWESPVAGSCAVTSSEIEEAPWGQSTRVSERLDGRWGPCGVFALALQVAWHKPRNDTTSE